MNIKLLDKYKNKKILIVGLGSGAFSYISVFKALNCSIKITDIRHIFDLNKEIKKLKKLLPDYDGSFGEYKKKDFLEADLIIYNSKVDSNLKELVDARKADKECCDEFSFPLKFLKQNLILVCGSYGKTTIVQMLDFALRKENIKVFSGGDSNNSLMNYFLQEEKADLLVLEVSPWNLKNLEKINAQIIIYPNIGDNYKDYGCASISDFMNLLFKPIKLSSKKTKYILNYADLYNHPYIKEITGEKYWYTRKSKAVLGVKDFQGVSFENRKIYGEFYGEHSFLVNETLVQGKESKENLLAAVTCCMCLSLSQETITYLINFFPGISHRLEFVALKNKVYFFNHSKAENMVEFTRAIQSMTGPLIVIAGGKEVEEDYSKFGEVLKNKVRTLILVGESKEIMNRFLSQYVESCFLVGSFDESVLIAYQKAKSGDKILLCPGCPSTDNFRDYDEKGKYYKKLITQL